MRWKQKVDNRKVLDTRTVEKFLWFPKEINGQYRWLETVKYEQVVVSVMNYPSMDYGYHLEWKDSRWL